MSLGFNVTDRVTPNNPTALIPNVVSMTPSVGVSSTYSVGLQNLTVNDMSSNAYNNTQNIGFVMGQALGNFLGTTHMSVAPLDYVANWIFERLPSTIQNWYDFPTKNSILIKKAIRDNDIDRLLKFIDQGESPHKILILSINQKNIPVIEFLLTLDIDIHQYGVYPDINTASTPYQAALISTYEIKKMFRERDLKNQSIEEGPKPKNPWTLQFEEVIKELNDLSNEVKYLNVTNEFGNRFYEPVINGHHFNLQEIIQKMDWQQVYFENECHVDHGHNQKIIGKYDEFYDRIYSFGHTHLGYYPWIRLFISGHSLQMNSFLKGEEYHYDLPDDKTITYFWIENGCLANDLNKRGYPNQNEILMRGQTSLDRVIRYNHQAYVSTSSDTNVVKSYQRNSPLVVFDANFGIDVSEEYINSQTIFYPTFLRDYQLFVIEDKPYYLAKVADFIENNPCPNADLINYNKVFNDLIFKIASNPESAHLHLNSNAYGQIYYDIIINDNHYDMYELISNMDWSTFTLETRTLEQLEKSKYHLWDNQVYVNFYSTKEGVDIVTHPICLTEINKKLDLLNRHTVPSQCGEYRCNYEDLYSDLSDTEIGLLFQYTSGSSKVLNSFLKGSVFEFLQNLQQHAKRWFIPSHIKEAFSVEDPLQWWIYSARLMHALNKIKSHEKINGLCRGQTHEDRHLRLEHPAPISFSPDLKICEKYVQSFSEGDIILVNDSHHAAKDLTGLSFHPLQKEFLHPPTFLNQYKSSSEKSYLTAKLTNKKMNCPKPVVKKAKEINNLKLKIDDESKENSSMFEKVAYGAATLGVIAGCEYYRRKRKGMKKRKE